MRLPFLLLERVNGPDESPAEKAQRRARSLVAQVKKARYEEFQREEATKMDCIRKVMREDYPSPSRRCIR